MRDVVTKKRKKTKATDFDLIVSKVFVCYCLLHYWDTEGSAHLIFFPKTYPPEIKPNIAVFERRYIFQGPLFFGIYTPEN